MSRWLEFSYSERMVSAICLLVALAALASAVDELVVNTSAGPVRGYYTKSYGGRTVIAFEGIPYAKPPVGDLRFKEPQPTEPWTNILDAKKTYICMQYTALESIKAVIGDEDCLYLHIYVPKTYINGNENLPVVVHIHSGAFVGGDPKSLAGPDYIMDRDVVFVSMNYRLGILGFLSTQDEAVSSNNGLKDQAFALKWINENIKRFGGNPHSVTLTGTLGGAAMVHLHYFSPLSKGLFNGGFSQGGTALNYWALTKNPLENAIRLGEKLNCPTSSTSNMVDCLKRKPGRDITLALGDFYEFLNFVPINPFGPVVEFLTPGAFLPDHPYKLLLEGRINDCPWVTSNTKHQGTIPMAYVSLYNQLDELDRRWDELAPYLLGYNETALDVDKTAIGRIIKNRYFNGESLSYTNLDKLIQLGTDRGFLVDTIKAITAQAKVSVFPIYYYFFEYYIDMASNYKQNLTVVGHDDDSRVLYRFKDNPAKLSQSDAKMKDIFIDFLYDFASKGTPSFKGLKWKPVNKPGEPITYMHVFSPETIRKEQYLNYEPLQFWHNLPLWENDHLFKYIYKTVEYSPFLLASDISISTFLL